VARTAGHTKTHEAAYSRSALLNVDIINRPIYIHRVPPKKLYNFLIDSDLAKGLKRLKAETGAAEGEILRRALREYLRKKNAITARRRRAAASKRRRED
jgi:hypothetical protein